MMLVQIMVLAGRVKAHLTDLLRAAAPVLSVAAGAVLLQVWAGPAFASTFYDWAPDTGSAGSGYMEFDTSGQTPSDFMSLDPIDFAFDFGVSGVPTVDFQDVVTLVTFNAEQGKLISGALGETPDFFNSNSLILSFRVDGAACSFTGSATSCSSQTVDLNIRQVGMWSLREQPAPIPLPAAFPLFACGMGLLGLLGWRRKRLAAA